MLNDERRLMYQGKLVHAPTDWSRWMYHVVLFDHYRMSSYQHWLTRLNDLSVVMTRPKVKDWVTRYHVQYRVRLSLFPSFVLGRVGLTTKRM